MGSVCSIPFMRVEVWCQATEGEKKDILWVFGILLNKASEIDYSIFLALWKQKFVPGHARIRPSPPSALPLPLPVLPHPLIHPVPGQAPAGSNLCCHMKEQHLIFPNLWALTSLPGAPGSARAAFQTFQGTAGFILEHNSEFSTWNKWSARPWLANNPSGNNWKRVISPPCLCCIYKIEHQFLTSLLPGKFNSAPVLHIPLENKC